MTTQPQVLHNVRISVKSYTRNDTIARVEEREKESRGEGGCYIVVICDTSATLIPPARTLIIMFRVLYRDMENYLRTGTGASVFRDQYNYWYNVV